MVSYKLITSLWGYSSCCSSWRFALWWVGRIFIDFVWNNASSCAVKRCRQPELHRLGWFVFQSGVFRWDSGGGVVVSGH